MIVKRLPVPRPGARRRHAAAVQLDHALDDREAEAEPGVAVALDVGALAVQLEEVRQQRGVDAFAVVLHGDLDLVVGHGHGDLDAARRRRA